MKQEMVQPFLKWAGGKRQLMNEINKILPSDINELKYYEPFLGGGAVFFDIQPKRAVINDSNGHLINVYEVIKNNVDELIKVLIEYKEKDSEEFYYNMRELDRIGDNFNTLSQTQKAARIIYLNKTCYNGLFRLNSKGEFNTPYGKNKNPNIINESVLRSVNTYLNSTKKIEIKNLDYKKALMRIRKNSFVYLDPPYWQVSNSSSFTGYTIDGFRKEDQIELSKICKKLNEKGVKFLLSNSDTELIKEIYSEFNIISVGANRKINSNTSSRGTINELLISNY